MLRFEQGKLTLSIANPRLVNSELLCALEITAPPIIFTTPKSPQHPLKILEHAVSSPAGPWQRLLTEQILQLQTLRFSVLGLPQIKWGPSTSHNPMGLHGLL
jgi:hypothetical protein